jgi:hypothetical protein
MSSDFITAWATRKPPFAILYTSFGAWFRDYYMSLQMSTTGERHALLWIPRQRAPLAVLRILQQMTPLAPCGLGRSQSMIPIPAQPSKIHNL